MSFRTFFQDQTSYLAQLTAKERRLLTSFFLFGLASPIFLIYTNTFLWRTSFNNSTTVILYNLGIYTGLSFGFLLNAALLRYVTAHRLYSLHSSSKALYLSYSSHSCRPHKTLLYFLALHSAYPQACTGQTETTLHRS